MPFMLKELFSFNIMKRLDLYLVEQQLVESRTQAQALIMSGQVIVNGQKALKSGQLVKNADAVLIKEQLPYVSRGGLKLAGALHDFNFDPQGLVVIDVGSSTGGFTDCLLQRGAIFSYCFDTGHNQLAYKLRSDPRVSVHEKVNFRYFTKNNFIEIKNENFAYPRLAVVDVSFISLKLILLPLFEILPSDSWVIALVKPQFEADRCDVGKAGIIRDPLVWQKVCDKVRNFSKKIGFRVLAETQSPIKGKTGNQEFFIHLAK